MPRPRQSSVTSRRGRDPSPSLPTVATLPLGCSVAAFTAAWERSHAVVLKRPRRTTRGSAALVPASGAFEAVRELLRDDPEIGATFTSECGSAPDSKRRRRLGLQVGSDQTRGAVLGRAAPPGGSWYCSWISAREDLLQAVPLSRPPCLPASAAQEAAVWWFVGRNGSSNEALPGRPEHTDEVSHDGTWHCRLPRPEDDWQPTPERCSERLARRHYQLEGSKEWRLRPTTELCERLRGGGRGGGGGGGGGGAPPAQRVVRSAGEVLVLSRTRPRLVRDMSIGVRRGGRARAVDAGLVALDATAAPRQLPLCLTGEGGRTGE